MKNQNLKENKLKKAKKDLLLIAVVLAIAAGGFLVNYMVHRQPAATLEVTVDSQPAATFDLSKNVDTIIEGYNGGTNHLVIENGVAWISEASCPDKVCVHQGRISMNGELIVCLPNRMIAKIVAPEE